MGDSKLFGGQKASRPHLTQPGGGLSGEIYDLRADIDKAFKRMEDQGGYFVTEEFTNPPAADVDAIKTSFSSSASVQQFTATAGDFNGAVGAGEMNPPRNVTITTSLHADIDAVAVTITGKVKNQDGEEIDQTDTITLTDGGNATDAGTKAFSRITQIDIPAQSGPGGSIQIGFGNIIGLGFPIKTRAGLTAPLREVSGGTVVTTGTFTAPAAKAPHGTYTPAAAPDGARDYALTYEVDPTA